MFAQGGCVRVTGLLSVPRSSLLSNCLFLPKTFLAPSEASRVITESKSPYVVHGLHSRGVKTLITPPHPPQRGHLCSLCRMDGGGSLPHIPGGSALDPSREAGYLTQELGVAPPGTLLNLLVPREGFPRPWGCLRPVGRVGRLVLGELLGGPS